MNHASLCFLSFERPQFVREAIDSAVANAGMSCEVVVHDDGSGPETVEVLTHLLRDGKISKLILSPPGHNEGVGAAFNRAVSVSTGDPVIKLDQDLIDFRSNWLRLCAEWLDLNPLLGMLGLFRYYYDPVDWQKMNHRTPSPLLDTAYEYVDDFVGSAMVIPREILGELGPLPEHSAAFAEDVEYKKLLQSKGLELALPIEDLATNRGFGIGPSTVVVAPDTVREIHDGPLLLGV